MGCIHVDALIRAIARIASLLQHGTSGFVGRASSANLCGNGVFVAMLAAAASLRGRLRCAHVSQRFAGSASDRKLNPVDMAIHE